MELDGSTYFTGLSIPGIFKDEILLIFLERKKLFFSCSINCCSFFILFLLSGTGNKPSATIQPFFLLHLDISHEAVHTIEDALDLLSAPEMLDEYRTSSSGKVCQLILYELDYCDWSKFWHNILECLLIFDCESMSYHQGKNFSLDTVSFGVAL